MKLTTLVSMFVGMFVALTAASSGGKNRGGGSRIINDDDDGFDIWNPATWGEEGRDDGYIDKVPAGFIMGPSIPGKPACVAANNQCRHKICKDGSAKCLEYCNCFTQIFGGDCGDMSECKKVKPPNAY